jgi:hypothetical protein
MDNQEQFTVPSRAEYIRLARESCSKNLSSTNGNGKNQGSNKMKGNEKLDKIKIKIWNQGYAGNITENQTLFTLTPSKLLLIRTVCAFLLFLSVFLIDRFDVKMKIVNSDFIQESILSNQTVEDAENFFVSVFQDFVKADEKE